MIGQDTNTLTTELRVGIDSIMLDEVLPMLETRQTMKKLREKLQSHPKDVSIDELASALQYSYVGSMVMAVCRQTDDDRRTLSLRNLIHTVLEHPDVFNRTWLSLRLKEHHSEPSPSGEPWKSAGGWIERGRNTTEFHRPSEVTEKVDAWGYATIEEDMAAEFFDECGHLDTKKVRDDLVRLWEDTKAITQYRNKFIAHSEKGAQATIIPQFADLDRAVDTIKELTKKYYLLLHQANFETDGSHLDDEWLALLPTCV